MPDAQACGLPIGGPFAFPGSMSTRVTSQDVLTARADFLAANRGLRVPARGFVLLVRPNEGRGMRYGNAVVRNRMKRRFRELLWAHLPEHGLPDHDHVLIGRDGGVERDFTKLSSELVGALAKAARGEGQRGRPPRRKRTR